MREKEEIKRKQEKMDDRQDYSYLNYLNFWHVFQNQTTDTSTASSFDQRILVNSATFTLDYID